MVFRVATTAVVDLARTSPRRVWALARLAIQESLRRNVLVALGVFVVVLLFAGWFLDDIVARSEHAVSDVRAHGHDLSGLGPGRVSSAFSLPADFKTRTIYTVVTKPVRPGEIVLGRILGLHADRHRAAGHDGRGQLRLCLSLARSHPRSRSGQPASRPARPPTAGPIGRTSLVARASARGATGRRRHRQDRHEERPLAQRHRRARRGQNPLRPLRAARECSSPACRSTAICGSRTGPATGSTAGSASARNGSIAASSREASPAAAIWTFHDVTPERFPDGPADRNDDPRLPQPQGRHQQGDRRQPDR